VGGEGLGDCQGRRLTPQTTISVNRKAQGVRGNKKYAPIKKEEEDG
jgi:hypothetical protein